MVEYSRITDEFDFKNLLDLQAKNHKINLTEETMDSQGFVTVRHTLQDLISMHAIEPSIIATNHHELVGYIIAMTIESRKAIDTLAPMFELFEKLTFENKKLSAYKYMVVGQVCVDESQRGHGVFDNMYQYYRKCFVDKYDFAITEISTKNLRSMRAHERVGFRTLVKYTDQNELDWNVVIWDWKE
jgi:hypothetical protein